jgi:hypothetical protein
VSTDRYVVLGMARGQAAWFADIARWATSAALPVDFVPVVSVEELGARLGSGRAFSALLVEATMPGCDRDLIDEAKAVGCAVVVVDNRVTAPPWVELGAATVISSQLDRDGLLDVLRAVSQPIARAEEPRRLGALAGGAAPAAWRGHLVAVTGAGGTGRSTLAMAVAAGLAADPRDRGLVELAALALNGQQGLLHDAGDVVPGLSELVEGHRNGSLGAEEVRKLCFDVADRGYDLLLGLRRQRDWTALRSRALRAALDGLRQCYRMVVAEIDADVEGEAECGSVDVEDRNMLARTAATTADLVLVVGQAGLCGLHAHLRVLRDLVGLGVDPGKLVPIVNRAPRSPRARAEISQALAGLLEASLPGVRLAANAVFVPERRRLDGAVRDGLAPPSAVVAPIAQAVRALVEVVPSGAGAGAGPASVAADEPVAVVPGSLGAWPPSDL